MDQHAFAQITPLIHRILIRKLMGIEGAYDCSFYAIPEAYSIANMGYLAVGVFHTFLPLRQAHFGAS